MSSASGERALEVQRSIPETTAEATIESDPAPNAEPETLYRHNESQPIFKLSPEILGLIIMKLRAVEPFRQSITVEQSPEGKQRLPAQLGWIHITHVCRLLRDVALAYGELWREIHLYRTPSTRLLPEWLRRSGSVPIKLVYMPFRLRGNEEEVICRILADVPQRMAQLQSFFAIITARSLELLPLLFTSAAPYLEALQISTFGPIARFPVLPSPWFGSEPVPQLRRLVIRAFYFSWCALDAPNLTHLEVTHERTPTSLDRLSNFGNEKFIWDVPEGEKAAQLQAVFSPTAEDLRDCLHRSPLLESLYLHNALPAISPAPTHSDIRHLRASLHQLRTLRLTEVDCGHCNLLLRMLDAPQLCHLLVNILEPVDERGIAEHATFVNLIARYVKQMKFQLYGLKLHVENYRWEMSVTQRVLSTRGPGRSQQTEEILYVSVQGQPHAQIADHVHRNTLHGLLNALPLEDVEMLDIVSTVHVSRADGRFSLGLDTALWCSVYERCSSVKVARIASSAVLAVLPRLACSDIPGLSQMEQITRDRRTPIFPQMTDLALSFAPASQSERCWTWLGDLVIILLTQGRAAQESTDEATPTQQYIQLLRECLVSRVGCAAALEHLYIEVPLREQDQDAANYEDRLRELVPDVEVVKLPDGGPGTIRLSRQWVDPLT